MDLIVCSMRGFPIRKSAGRRIFAPNRSLSQLVTSFIGSQCQGILLVLFLAWPLCLNLLELFEIVRLSSFDDTHLIFHIRISFLIQLALAVYYLLFSFQSTSIYKTALLFYPMLVGLSGLEPPTSRLSGVRSNQLSYKPVWWRWGDSNPWPPACRAGALPAELHPRIS